MGLRTHAGRLTEGLAGRTGGMNAQWRVGAGSTAPASIHFASVAIFSADSAVRPSACAPGRPLR